MQMDFLYNLTSKCLLELGLRYSHLLKRIIHLSVELLTFIHYFLALIIVISINSYRSLTMTCD